MVNWSCYILLAVCFVNLDQKFVVVSSKECSRPVQHLEYRYTCESHQYCCSDHCCDEFYAVWYVWVLFGAILLFCCLIGYMIRKKKLRKNRISHSMFLERLRERAEERAREELIMEQTHSQQHHELPSIQYNDAAVVFHTGNHSVGIGGSRNSEVSPLPNSIPSDLFSVRAPPPYSTRSESSDGGRGGEHMRNDQPPSYDSIFS